MLQDNWPVLNASVKTMKEQTIEEMSQNWGD
jgi:hypothetical protein